mgnify:CR=1 FL=1
MITSSSTRGLPSGSLGHHVPSAEINVTPLVDVMLVLLVVFMVTAPLLASGLKLDLPQAATARPLEPKEPIVVSIDRDGRVSVGNDITDRERIVAAVRALGADETRTIRVRGDRGVSYGDVVEIVDTLAGAGLRRIALVSEPPRTAQSPTDAGVIRTGALASP